MISTRSVGSIDSFEVIFDIFLYILLLQSWLDFFGSSVPKGWRFICIKRVFHVGPQKNFRLSNRIILVASWYHDSRQIKVGYHMTITLRILRWQSFRRHFRWSKVQSHLQTEERTKHWFLLDVISSLQLLEDPQNPKYDNFIYSQKKILFEKLWSIACCSFRHPFKVPT